MNEASLPAALHGRLTVVRADPGADVAGLARELAAGLAAAGVGGVDLRPSAGTVVDAAEVRRLAAERAARAYEQRAAVRDAAVSRRTGVATRRAHLLDRAEWCETNAPLARAVHASLEEADTAVAAAQAAVDEADARRTRVVEQRAMAQAAVEEARLELEGLDGAAMDETGVRRELEAATRAARDTAAALAAAEEEVAALRARLAELDAARAELVAARDALTEAGAVGGASAEVEAAVADALAYYDANAVSMQDPVAASLAEAIAAVEADIAELRRTVPEPPTAAAVEGAEADVAGARRAAERARASVASFPGTPPAWWTELTALHAAAVDAEAAVETSGLRRKAANRRYDEAKAAERARLDELGFASYFDALTSGGRLPGEGADDDGLVAGAAANLAAAEARLEQLHAARLAAAPLEAALADRRRFVEDAAGLLACDPGDRLLELLAEHPSVPPTAVREVADTLRAAGVSTRGVGVAAAARRWLDERAAQQDAGRLAEIEGRLAEIAAEHHGIESALTPAGARAERAAAEAAAATRTVTSLEGELQARAGEDGRLLQRATAARELRDQVEAVEARLAAAETEALEAWAAAGEVLATAVTERDRLEHDLGELDRRASRVAGELPPERRPAFDLVNGLVPLAGALRAEAAALADELADADVEATAAEAAVGAGPDDPTADDFVEAVVEAVRTAGAGAGRGPVVLAEPVDGVDPHAVEPVLAALAEATAAQPVVVVTADLAVAGWAIGLPAAIGALLPARSLDDLLVPAHPARKP